ncbi:unnamed protein product [Rhizophagus irregularis]|uniref:FAR1 domain-containing protein n=1 Tax=Rhizophagus irregularis TaxID=588596 RepID=A0A915YXE3_9GLOM|nr:unnamed protein product [Rhizophagus irregularis]CAB5351388.1 unnamed protein product [Rhizophagus irregularis]
MSYNNCIQNAMDVFAYEQNATLMHHVIHVNKNAATLAHFTSNIDDATLTDLTSYVVPDADGTLTQYTSPTCLMLYPSAPSLPTSDDTLQDDESDGDSDNQPLELVSGLTFISWDEFKNWLDRFALKEGFDHKIRTSEKDQGILRRVTYKCTKSGSHNPQITSDPTKHRNAFSSRMLCSWKLNVTCPKKMVL